MLKTDIGGVVDITPIRHDISHKHGLITKSFIILDRDFFFERDRDLLKCPLFRNSGSGQEKNSDRNVPPANVRSHIVVLLLSTYSVQQRLYTALPER
jgi:hypothetical protein